MVKGIVHVMMFARSSQQRCSLKVLVEILVPFSSGDVHQRG